MAPDKAAEARAWIDRLRAVNPAAADLAALCSLALRAEPTLVRRLRLLLPGADVTAESDLWASELLSGATVTAIAVAPEVAAQLRADLRAPRWDGVRAAAFDAVAAEHAREHWSQRLEEQLHRMEVLGAPDRDREDLLLAALRELVEAGDAVPAGVRRRSTILRGRDVGEPRTPDLTPQQAGIARWLLGALARLPRADGESDAGRVVRLGADLHLRGQAPDADTSDVVSAGWLPWLLDRAGGPPLPVSVGFAGGVLDVGGRGAVVEVPRTDPLVLDVDWHDGRRAQHRRLRFAPGERATVNVCADRVELTALDGSGVTLRIARRPSAGLDFSAERARRRPCLAREAEIERTLSFAMGLATINGGRGSGRSVLACAVADRVERRGGIVAQHFFGVEPRWDTTEAVVASLVSQLPAISSVDSTLADDVLESRLMTALGAAARSFRTTTAPPVVVLLDSLPSPAGPNEERTVADLLAQGVPHGVLVVATVDDAAQHASILNVVDLTDRGLAVCTAILDWHVAGLRAAFGTDLDADPAPSVPHRDDLIALAGGNPGHLCGMVEWLLDRPAGNARLDDIPYLLTTREREIGRRLEEHTGLPREIIDPAAVALPGYTVDDVRRLAGPGGDEIVRGTVSAVRGTLAVAAEMGLLTLDGPVTAGTTTVTPHPRLAAWIAERFGASQEYDGHTQHLRPLMDDESAIRPLAPVLAPPSTARIEDAGYYTIAAAVHHALHRFGRNLPYALRVCLTGAWLHRRAVEGGNATLLADLRSVAEVAPADAGLAIGGGAKRSSALLHAAEEVASAEPERFVELLVNALRHDGHDAVADELLRTAWSPALRVLEVVPLDVAAATWVAPIAAAAALDDGRIVTAGPDGVRVAYSPDRAVGPKGAIAVAVAGDTVFVAAGTQLHRLSMTALPPPTAVTRRSRDVPGRTLPLPGAATALAATYETVAAGTAHGVIAVAPVQAQDATLLVGHGDEVTTLLIAFDDVLVSGSADGTARSWKPQQREQLAVVPHRGAVRQAVMTEDGVIVTADDAGHLVWWIPSTGEILRRVNGHDGPVTGLFVDEIGATVISAGADGRLRRWANSPASDHDAAVVDTDPVQLLARTSAGFVTWHGSSELRWWDDVTGQQTGVATPLGIVPPVVGLYTDGNDAVVVVHAGGAVTLSRDPPSDAHLALLTVDAEGIVTAGTPEGLFRLDGQSRRTVATESLPVSIATDEHGQLVITASDELRWLDAGGRVTGRDSGGYLVGGAGSAVAVAYRGGFAGILPPQQSSSGMVAVPAFDVTALAVSGRDTLVVGERTGIVRYAVRESGGALSEAHRNADTGAPVTALAVSGRWVVVGTADGQVLRWNPAEPGMTLLGRHDGPVTGLAVIAEPPLVLCHAGLARRGIDKRPAAEVFLTALRGAGIDVRTDPRSIAPRRNSLQSQEDAARAADAVLVVLAEPLDSSSAGGLEVEAAVRAASPAQPVIPVLVNPDVPLPPSLRDRQAASIRDVEGVLRVLRGLGSGPVVSASVDGTVRVWDVPLGAEWARYAAPGPVHAIAAVPGMREVVARTGPGELTRLGVAERPPARAPVIVDEAPTASSLRLRATEVCELRAFGWDTAAMGRKATGLHLVGPDSRFPVELRPDGRLVRPRRLHPDDGAVLEIGPIELWTGSVSVTVTMPDRPDELTFPLRFSSPEGPYDPA